MNDFIIDLLDEILILTGADEYTEEIKKQYLIKSIENLFIVSDNIMNLTKTEIKHSFYLNHSGVYGRIHHIYHGKTITADYVGNVISDYGEYKIRPLEKKFAIDRLLNPPEEKPIPVYTIEDYKLMIQQDYENHQKGNINYIYNIDKKYVLMRRMNGKGIIIFSSRESWKKWYMKGLGQREQNMYYSKPINDAEKLKRKNALSMYEAIKETKIIPSEEHHSTIYMMRKLVYFKYFEHMAKAGIKDIFKEIHHTESEW